MYGQHDQSVAGSDHRLRRGAVDRLELRSRLRPSEFKSDDPAALDVFGRPVTEGAFFAAGAPFNLLVPGVIVLDNSTLQQTGTLFGVEGGTAAPIPALSGSGVLAYVEFVTTAAGTGNSTIRVTDPVTATAVVPEPSALLLLGSALGALVPPRVIAPPGRTADVIEPGVQREGRCRSTPHVIPRGELHEIASIHAGDRARRERADLARQQRLGADQRERPLLRGPLGRTRR